MTSLEVTSYTDKNSNNHTAHYEETTEHSTLVTCMSIDGNDLMTYIWPVWNPKLQNFEGISSLGENSDELVKYFNTHVMF